MFTFDDMFVSSLHAGAPSLRDNYMIKIIEATQNAEINLSLEPQAFPIPQSYQWTKGGSNVDSNTNLRITYTYPTAIFEEVLRADSGRYSLSASNYVPMNSTLAIGNDDGDFELDVLCKFKKNYIHYSYVFILF